MKKLTKANCGKVFCEVADQYSFTDDGNHFRGFLFKGELPITQCYSEGVTYLSIRSDYILQSCMYPEYRKTSEYRLEDSWIACKDDIDENDFVFACDCILKKVKELNNNIQIDEKLLTKAYFVLLAECSNMKTHVEMFKNVKWWLMCDSDFSRSRDDILSINSKIKRCEEYISSIENDDIDICLAKELCNKVKEDKDVGEYDILSCEYYIKDFIKLIQRL